MDLKFGKIMGKKCVLLNHICVDPCLPNNNAVRSCVDLMNQSRHIYIIFYAQSFKHIQNNRLCVKMAIDEIH